MRGVQENSTLRRVSPAYNWTAFSTPDPLIASADRLNRRGIVICNRKMFVKCLPAVVGALRSS